jgi:hypothetical protein
MSFQFKIELLHISDPPVWRRLIIPEGFTFLHFHQCIQIAFGWQNCHLFQFFPQGFKSAPTITIPNPEWDEGPVQDCRKVKLDDIFKAAKQTFTYLYDFGDDWVHSILLEEISQEKIIRATCLLGEGACPPEDCGGPPGYDRLKMIMKDPKNPENREMKGWLGLSKSKPFDPFKFDVLNVNKKLGQK